MHSEYKFDESIYNDDFEDKPYDDMHGLQHCAFGMPNTSNMLKENEIPHVDTDLEELNDEGNFFLNILENAEKELCPGCTKFMKLAFIIRLIHMKCLNGWSNNLFTML